MKQKIKPIYFYLITGIIFIFIIIILTKKTSLNSNNLTKPLYLSTPSSQLANNSDTTANYDVNPIEETKAWNDAYNANLEYYLANRNPIADKNLSEIRLNSPIIKSEFRIDYNYKNSTYTITLQNPYDKSKKIALDWFDKQEINQKIRDEMRIKWVNSVPL